MNANWNYNGNIYEAFTRYYDEMFRRNEINQNIDENSHNDNGNPTNQED